MGLPPSEIAPSAQSLAADGTSAHGYMTSGTLSLVVGADGQLGRALFDALAGGGAEVMGTSRRRPPRPGRIYLDLAAGPQQRALPASIATAYLCAAVTSLAACRQDPSGSRQVNVQRTVEVARMLAGGGAFVVFLSTNLVYDGSVAFRSAQDPTCPRTEYGRQKADAERHLLALGDHAAVVRLTKVLSGQMPLFSRWRSALGKGETIQPFSDLVMAPVSLPFAVYALTQIASLRRPGIFQISGNRDVSYAEAARHLAGRLGASPELVQPVPSQQAGTTLEALPAHTTLEMSRLRSELALEPPDVWQTIEYAAGL
jgi:dTDP-4-dehydrorhamnose reductase